MDEALIQVGPRLRAARHSRGWTLDDLADRASISASTLSRLESGKRQATLELLVPLTRILGIRVDDLLPAAPGDPRVRRTVIRRDGLVFEPLMPENSPIRTYRITYPPAQDPPKARVHDGHEWLYVVSGQLRLVLGDAETILTPGEAAQFDTRVPHSMSAEGPGPADVISIFNDEGEKLHAPVGPGRDVEAAR